MATEDRRIAWLLTAEAVACGSAGIGAHLSVAAAAGFGVVAMTHSTAPGGIVPEIQAEAMRLGMQCVLVDDAAHCRLGRSLSPAERRPLAQALSRNGFDGFILCDVYDTRSKAESLLSTARALLRDLDQLDWEAYH